MLQEMCGPFCVDGGDGEHRSGQRDAHGIEHGVSDANLITLAGLDAVELETARIVGEDAPEFARYRADDDEEFATWRAMPLDAMLERIRTLRRSLSTRVESLTTEQLQAGCGSRFSQVRSEPRRQWSTTG